ncbi:MAG: hypothetical protein WB822_22625 [Rhodoplanes sp.]
MRGAVATYRGFHDEQADGTVDACKDAYTTMVSGYYDLVTDIYERGWGAADDEVLAVVGLASDQQMDMRVVGIPVLGGDPVGLSLEIAPEELAAAGRDYCAALESLGSQKIVFRKECRFDSDHPHHADIGGPEEQNNPRRPDESTRKSAAPERPLLWSEFWAVDAVDLCGGSHGEKYSDLLRRDGAGWRPASGSAVDQCL